MIYYTLACGDKCWALLSSCQMSSRTLQFLHKSEVANALLYLHCFDIRRTHSAIDDVIDDVMNVINSLVYPFICKRELAFYTSCVQDLRL